WLIFPPIPFARLNIQQRRFLRHCYQQQMRGQLAISGHESGCPSPLQHSLHERNKNQMQRVVILLRYDSKK
ncbi:MAG: hypothetical protein VX171_06400, partial [Pseudomonadota bacterium]|nr:hypothetical protein [Pseudomonadota bacterium]